MPVLALAQAVLPTAWDFSNPGVANPPTGWSYSLGTSNLTYQSGVGDNVSLRLDVTGEYLQVHFADKPGPLSYYIRSQYGSNPGYTGTFSIQESVDGSSWSSIRQFTDGQLGNTLTRYQHTLSATSRFVRFYFTNKISGSNVQIDSVMIQAPPPPASGISVFQNAMQLINGGTFVFGNATARSFTLQNFGVSANLQVDSVTVEGQHASDFSVGAFDQTITPNNGTGSLAVQFTAGAPGSRFATMKIYSSDPERNPFVIGLYGIGGSLATEPASSPSVVTIGNVRPFGMNVSFGKAAGGAEKYIVLRKEGAPVNEIPVDGVTYKKGDYIGGSQVAYVGTDTALLRPTYILAGITYSFAAFSFNGPDGYENYQTGSLVRETVTTPANEIGTYYTGVNPNDRNFITTLAARVRNPHDTVFYSNYAPAIVNTFLTRDTTGGKKVVNCVYTGIAYVYEDPFLWQASSNTTGILTREHTFAQSWMPTRTLSGFPNVGGREILEYNDLHHLFPADQNNANGVRSNLPFGVVVNANSVSPTGFGKRGTDSRGITVYEPKDDQKGNLARALFYMLVRYDGERGNQWRLPTNQEISVLLQWHQQDPPDALEIARNDYIATMQHNRNPFIDHPQWVNRINFSNMTYVPDSSAGILSLTAPVANATVVAGTAASITWTSYNVDSVLVELQTAPQGTFNTIGKYAASLGTVVYTFNEAATNTAVIRISKVSDAEVNALSGTFRIVQSSLRITEPSNDSIVFIDGTPKVIKWEKSYVDSVDVTLYASNAITGSVDTVLAGTGLLNDSLVYNPVGYDTLWIVVSERSGHKAGAYRASDMVRVFVKAKLIDAVNEHALLNDVVSVYPVPSNGRVHVDIKGTVSLRELRAYDITGRLVDTSIQNSLDLKNKGLYFLHVITDKGMAVKKVVIE